jgi:hypothetical protein
LRNISRFILDPAAQLRRFKIKAGINLGASRYRFHE